MYQSRITDSRKSNFEHEKSIFNPSYLPHVAAQIIISHQQPIYGSFHKNLVPNESTLTYELIEPLLAYKTVLCQDTSCRTLNNAVCLVSHKKRCLLPLSSVSRFYI